MPIALLIVAMVMAGTAAGAEAVRDPAPAQPGVRAAPEAPGAPAGAQRPASGAPQATGAPHAIEPPTLCVLDFNRLGDDGSMDWLGRGLADMMITTLHRLGPYRIIDRQHLREILAEHGLAVAGWVDDGAGIRRARLAGAELLLLGNFVRQKAAVTIELRLIRVADQRPLATARWIGQVDDVPAAPAALSNDLLAAIGSPAPATPLEGIERYVPRDIDVAEAFYRGLEAFDDGRYPEALAHYLDAARGDGRFTRGDLAAIDMYVRLGRAEHAVVHAAAVAARLEASDLRSALRFHHLAAQHALASVDSAAAAIAHWSRIVELAEAEERRTGQAAATRAWMRERILALHETGEFRRVSDILATPDLRYGIWTYGIDVQGRDMDEPRGTRTVLRDGTAVTEPIPEPSVFMWKTRAQLQLARAYVRQGDARTAIATYDAILDDYAFIRELPLSTDETHLWGRDVELEALFMILHHYRATGELLRDPRRMVVLDGDARATFERDYSDHRPDPRARVWSRRPDGGHEYFDFAAPVGYQIDRAMVRVGVGGVSLLSVDVPDPKGWPPRYDFSRRLHRFTFYRGPHERTIDLPEGTEFFSASFLWGPRWLDDPWQLLRWRMASWVATAEVDSLVIEFELSPNFPPTAPAPPADAPATPADAATHGYADSLVVEHFAKPLGWDGGTVLRPDGSLSHSSLPARDVATIDWLVYAQDGDIQIIRRRRPEVHVDLPPSINSGDDEYDPSLIATHHGDLALLFSRRGRGRGDGPDHFVARSRDLVDWQAPQRLRVEDGGDDRADHRADRGQFDTDNVVAIPHGYLMVLDRGLVRHSEDVRHWAPPVARLDLDGPVNDVVKTADGRIWVVGTRDVDEPVPPGAPRDAWAGYFTSADGKTYLKGEAVEVTTSVDGVEWSPPTRLWVDRETSGLWAFPMSPSQIGIAVSYNNYFLRWGVSGGPQTFFTVDSPVSLLLESKHVRFFVDDTEVVCLRPVHDFVEEEGVALLMRSRSVYERLRR